MFVDGLAHSLSDNTSVHIMISSFQGKHPLSTNVVCFLSVEFICVQEENGPTRVLSTT